MAKVSDGAGQHTAQENQTTTLNAEAGDRLALPSSDFIADAKMTRDGDDLVLQNSHGETVVIGGYFSADPAPLLTSPDGSVLTPKLVDSFLSSGNEYAARATANDESPVGAVQEVKGHATVTHADGTKETVTIGTAIYQGDVIETDGQGAVNITFIDETTMAVSENARFAVDNYNYDPATESGTTNFSVLRGLFVFTSGLIGRDDPDDVKIETPVGSIGIRGTIIAGQINPHGESNITVLEGAIVVTNGMGQTTLSHAFETVKVMGYDVPMHEMGVVPAHDIMTRFGTVSTVAPTLFTSINDSAAEQPHSQGNAPVQNVMPQEQPNGAETTSPVDTQSTAPTNDGATLNTAPDILAPPPADLGTMDMSGSTMSTGLPGTTTVMGQPTTTATVSGTGLFDPTLQIQPVTTTTGSTSTPGTTQTVTTSTTTTQTTTGGTTTLSPILPPPNTTGTGGTASGPVVTFTPAAFNDLSVAGVLVGHIDTGIAGTTYNFVNGTGDFTFTANGTGYDVFLNTAGSAKLLNSINTAVMQTITVDATLPAGNVLNSSFVPTAQNANGLNTFDIDNVTPRVAHIGDGGAVYDAGYSISALGDVNNDGFDDIVFSNNTSAAGQNHSYILYGGSGFLTSTNIPSIVSAGATQNGINVISNPTGTLDWSGSKVSGIGDFNGDGIEDYIVGQANNGPSVTNVGQISIVNGATNTSLASFPGTNGSLTGASVSGVGDVDNDGYADALFGAPGADIAYLYKGDNSAPAWVSQTGVTGSNFGEVVEGIGDFNGDGYNDFVVGASSNLGNNGTVYLYQGNSSGAFVPMGATVSGATGSHFGSYLSSLGDINGDGLSDFYVGDTASAGKIFMGNASGMTTNINFNFSSTPYTVTGVGSAGDFNGDGYDDFVISLADSGETHAFMVFGKSTGLPGTLDLNYLKNGANAIEYTFNTANNSDRLDITSVGDLNGDGYDDFAIGAYDVNGTAAGTGGMTVIYGRNTAGTPASAHVGTVGNDLAGDGGGTGHSFHMGAGNDVIALNNTSFLGVDGGTGMNDTIRAMGNLDFTNVNYEKMSGVEQINFGANNETITLTMENLFNLMKTSDSGMLKIGLEVGVTGANSHLVIADTNTGTDAFAGTANTNTQLQAHLQANTSGTVGLTTPVGYNVFTIGGYKLMIDDSIVVDAQ